MRVEPRRDECPELVEHPGARQHDPHQKRGFHIDPKRLLGAEGGDAHSGIPRQRLPQQHRHQLFELKCRLFRRQSGGRRGSFSRTLGRSGGWLFQHTGQPIGMHFSQFKREFVIFYRIDNLRAGVGQGGAAGHSGLPSVEGFDRPLGVVGPQRSPQRRLNEVHHRLRHQEADQHRHSQPRGGPDKADAQFLQMLAECHRGALEEIFVVDAGHGAGSGRWPRIS